MSKKKIEDRTSTLFKDMMSALYSVLDQCYYYLYCYFQNEGQPSFHKDAFNIKTPVQQKLIYSNEEEKDKAFSGERNKFVSTQCIAIFGSHCFNGEGRNYLRDFQNNLLRLQTITEVDQAGDSLHTCFEHNPCEQGQQCTYRAPKLVYAKKITHPPGTEPLDPSSFNPAVTFEELKSVEKLDDWNETTTFNLLHFFRNFTTHRALIRCSTKKGYLNLETREFKAKGEGGAGDDWPWIPIAEGAWILVPEVSHLKDKDRKAVPKFHLHPLQMVCSTIVSFVEHQRLLLLKMAGYCEPPIAVTWGYKDKMLVFKRDYKQIGRCRGGDCYTCFRLWPV